MEIDRDWRYRSLDIVEVAISKAVHRKVPFSKLSLASALFYYVRKELRRKYLYN
jgi:hypothetical protein